MFGLNKQELYLGQFANLILQAILSSKASDSLPKDGSLTDKEISHFKEELLYLRVELLMVKFMEIKKFGKKFFSNQEIGKAIGIALGVALNDIGVGKSETIKIMDILGKRIGEYESYIINIEKSQLQKTGIYFQILLCFTEMVLGKGNKRAMTEEGRDKDFTVFSYAKQIYKSDEEAFKDTYKHIRFLD